MPTQYDLEEQRRASARQLGQLGMIADIPGLRASAETMVKTNRRQDPVTAQTQASPKHIGQGFFQQPDGTVTRDPSMGAYYNQLPDMRADATMKLNQGVLDRQIAKEQRDEARRIAAERRKAKQIPAGQQVEGKEALSTAQELTQVQKDLQANPGAYSPVWDSILAGVSNISGPVGTIAGDLVYTDQEQGVRERVAKVQAAISKAVSGMNLSPTEQAALDRYSLNAAGLTTEDAMRRIEQNIDFFNQRGINLLGDDLADQLMQATPPAEQAKGSTFPQSRAEAMARAPGPAQSFPDGEKAFQDGIHFVIYNGWPVPDLSRGEIQR